MTRAEKRSYGTWIRKRAMLSFAALTVGCAALALLAFWSLWWLVALVPAGAFAWIALVLFLAHWRFSERGGDYQRRIHELIAERTRGKRVLDIGCGNGHLAILLAKRLPDASITGLDFWGSAWEYSRSSCERNATLEGVASVQFVNGSAVSLPWQDGTFDAVVSCLTFHEIRELADKTMAVREALRVLRPGGMFAFIDLFSEPKAFPRPALIAQRVAEGHATLTTDEQLSALLALPFPLNGGRLLKHARLLSGTKTSSWDR